MRIMLRKLSKVENSMAGYEMKEYKTRSEVSLKRDNGAEIAKKHQIVV
jgi:hypothetical protein